MNGVVFRYYLSPLQSHQFSNKTQSLETDTWTVNIVTEICYMFTLLSSL